MLKLFGGNNKNCSYGDYVNGSHMVGAEDQQANVEGVRGDGVVKIKYNQKKTCK